MSVGDIGGVVIASAFSGGISGAAIALGATERIPVGIGVVSAVTRHPAVLAMELATGETKPFAGTAESLRPVDRMPGRITLPGSSIRLDLVYSP